MSLKDTNQRVNKLTKLDLTKAAPIIEVVQKEMENEVAVMYRQAQMTRYQRIYVAAYEQCERDYKVGKFTEKQ